MRFSRGSARWAGGLAVVAVVVAVVVAAVVAWLLVGRQTVEPEPLPPNVQSECALAQGDGPKIAVAYGVGGRGDRGVNDSAFEGVAKAIAKHDATCIEDEAVEGESDTVREERLRRMADGSSVVVAVGVEYSDAVNDVAPDFPKVDFGIIDGQDTDDETNGNVAYLRFAEDEGSFLVGAAAALKSKTDTVGFLGGVHDERTRRYEAGYRAGAQAVAPDVKVLVTYLKETADQEKTPDEPSPTEAAGDLFDQDADVVYQVAAGTGSGVFNAAVDAEAWAIGSEYDQYQTATEDQRTRILTSMVKRTDTVTYDFIRRVDRGATPSGTLTYGVKARGVDYATSGGYVANLEGRLASLADRVAAGEITIPASAPTSVPTGVR